MYNQKWLCATSDLVYWSMRKVTFPTDTRIRQLYLQERSARDVARTLNLPLHRIYASLKRQKVPRRTLDHQHRIRLEREPLSFSFLRSFTRKQRDLMVAGLMLYQGEGAKTGTTVDLANSDLLVHKVFLTFLREVCVVTPSRLRCYLYCFSDQSATGLIRYWSRSLSIPAGQFTQPYVRTVTGPLTRRTAYGVLHIRYSDKRLLAKILGLIAEVGDSLV
jgi:hypothetical protein